MKEISIEEVLELQNSIIVDVRTPKEYEEDHIPESINIPIFDDDERAIIGTLYKQKGKEIAVKTGIEITSPKLQDFYNKYLTLSKQYNQIILYCFRGGMRSGSLVNFLNEMGLNVLKISGGYKSYRNYVLDYLENLSMKHQFIVLHGHTGTGKTQLLEALEEKGCCVLNLEALAQNSGSVYGEIFYSGKAPTQKWFDSRIVKILRESKFKNVLMESESKKIGKVTLCKSFWDTMTDGKHILVNSSAQNRVIRLVKDYTKYNTKDDEYLKKSTVRLKDTIGTKAVEDLINKIENKDYEYVAHFLILNYYDKLYSYSIDKYKYDMSVSSDEIDLAVSKILEYYDNAEKEI